MIPAPVPDLSALHAYVAAWSAPDLARAEALLRQGCADGCDIVGPGYHLAGLDAVLQEMRRFHREQPGWSAVATSGFDAHGRWVRFGIATLDPEGRRVHAGWDVVELDASARVARVVTFWGPLPGSAATGIIADMNARLPEAAAAADPIALEDRYGARNYHPLPVVLARGDGVHLWDSDGRRYLDMMSAYSAVSFGHSHPVLLAALSEQAARLAVTSRAFHSDRLGPFLQRLCTLTGMDRALPMNSGAEAVETAIKAARKWGYAVKGIGAGRARIVVADGNFAGRTTTIVGFSSETQYRDGFGPFTPGFDSVPFGDAAALQAAITPDTCAFIVEPIQGEAGIVVPPDGYLRAVRDICSRHGVLLICDEIQTGLGRTGALLACDHEGVRPDGLTLGKALGGGLLPVSAFLARADVMDVFNPGDHGSTFGGNPLAAAVGLAALDLLQRERLADRAAELGAHLMASLRALRHPAIRDVRGRGLLVGVEIDPAQRSARSVCEALLGQGVLTKDTHGTVVRLAPPLVVTREQIDETVAALARVL